MEIVGIECLLLFFLSEKFVTRKWWIFIRALARKIADMIRDHVRILHLSFLLGLGVYYCIAVVGQSIVSCFRIVTNLFSFLVRETYVINPEFEGVNPRELMDTSVNGWVHHCMNILPQVKRQN